MVTKNKIRNGGRHHNGRRWGPNIWPRTENGGHEGNELAPLALAFVLDPLRHLPGLEEEAGLGVLPDWSQAAEIKLISSHPIHQLLPDVACGTTFAGFALSGEVPHVNGNGKQEALQQQLAEAEQRRKEAEQQLVLSHQQTTQARMLASQSAHDLNNLLTAVLGNLSLLVAAGLHPGQEEMVRPAQRAGETMAGIVQDVLQLVRMQNAKTPCTLQPVELDGLAATVIGFCAQAAGDKNLQVTFERSPAVPAVIMGDPLQLQRVLLNLLTNAIKFTPAGRTVVIRMVTVSDDNAVPHLSVSVSDTGIGMSEATLARLFQPFARADESVPGTGLGLIIARQLVEVMGGRLEVESQEGQGTTFWFTLPLAASSPVDRTSAADLLAAVIQDKPITEAVLSLSALPIRASTVLPQFSGHVLVVEPEGDLHEMLRRQLSALELGAMIVQNGMEALEATRAARRQRTPFALILMSSRLAKGSCLAIAERIRSEEMDQDGQDAHVPMIALMDGSEEMAVTDDLSRFDQVMDGLLRKPFTPVELAGAIAEVLVPSGAPACAVT